MTLHCPSCGKPMDAVPLDALAEAPISPQRRFVLNALIRAYPRYVSSDRLWNELYGGRADGGPDIPGNLIAVLISGLRRVLPQFGWTVTSAKAGDGSRGRYRLQPIQEA